MSQKIKIDQIADVTATATELNYTDGVTSNIQTQLDAKLALAGGTMSGAIAMGTNAITGMADPSSAQDAATKAYVDANAGGSVTVSSDTTTNAERLIYVGSTTTGSLSAVTQDSGLTYNPSTGSLTSAAFIGEVTGNVTGSAGTATSATTAGTVTTAAQPTITSVGTLTSLDVTNNITVGGTVDGVDIASRDSVLTSTTTTANAALPKTGGAMTGAITTNSTFDGRDVATDGTKLDTIETNADVTDATNVAAAGAAMTSNNLSDLSNASTARTNLGVAIGSNVQAYDADLTAIGGLAKTDGNFIVGNGSTWVAESGATARASLGLTIGTNVQAYSSVLQNTTASFLTADETKLDYISVTQAVDLDQMETDIAALANGMVYKGDWDASTGSFPGSGSAQTGWFYYVSVAGTVNGISFAVGDNIVATTDNASTSTYAGNWSKHDQTDAVQAVVGLTGSITKSSLLSALNVEDGADVTDSTNVTAAGALMDSEVDADIKTLSLPANTTISAYGATLVDDADAATARTTLGLGTAATTASTDYATAAQGTTADAALPKTGGAMTGAITTNSTFDGRDVATDGTKLDTIETNADVTDATNVAAAGALMTTGGSVTGNVSFGDNDKAIFGAGSDLQIYHDGSNSIINDAGTGSLKFQYGGTDGVVLDSSGNVGIGTSTPNINHKLTIVDVSGNGGGTLGLNVSSSGISDNLGRLQFGNATDPVLAAIFGVADGSADSGALTFRTEKTGEALEERMRIDSVGNVSIGTAATPEKLSIEAPLSTLAGLGLTYSGATKAVFSVLPSTGEVRIGGTAANYFPTFYSSGTERMRITAAGVVDVTGSITVSGTVDGRDVATDGTKLDGIATGATNVTNNNQLTNGAGYVTSSGVTSVAAGSYLTGGTITSTGTLAVNATSANTASTVVARDGSGNFSAGVITATATAARYADLAEKYTSDVQYPPGTVVELGGEAEVTRSTGPNSRKIAGIVSTDPAYLMNNDLEGDTVVDVALIGRVPCMVTGIVSKGDLLVSSSQPGHACAWTNATNPPAGSVVGKAIENKTDENPGVIEVLVGRM